MDINENRAKRSPLWNEMYKEIADSGTSEEAMGRIIGTLVNYAGKLEDRLYLVESVCLEMRAALDELESIRSNHTASLNEHDNLIDRLRSDIASVENELRFKADENHGHSNTSWTGW